MASATPEQTRARVTRAMSDEVDSPAAHVMRALASGQPVRTSDGARFNRTRALVSIVLQDMRHAGWRVESVDDDASNGNGRNAKVYRVVADPDGAPVQPREATWLDDVDPARYPKRKSRKSSAASSTGGGKTRTTRETTRKRDAFARPAAPAPALGSLLRVIAVGENAEGGIEIALADRDGGSWRVRTGK